MKREKLRDARNIAIGTVIAVAMLAAPTLLLLGWYGWLNPAPDPIPNADFGLVEAVYRQTSAVEITDCTGDTDIMSIDYVLPNYPDGVYKEYVRTDDYGWWLSDSNESNALTLHLRATVHVDSRFALTTRHYRAGKLLSDESALDLENDEGCIEKLVDGEWVRVGGFILEREIYRDEDMEKLEFKTLHYGVNSFVIRFPLHEPGTYRLTYNFRTITGGVHTRPTTGAEQYTVSHTLTIPEPSGKKFDLIAPDISRTTNGRVRVAALCRSNDDRIPYQNLENTRLEKLVDGEWVDASGALTLLADSNSDYGYFSPVGYDTTHPFTGEEVGNLFCGVAEFKYESRTTRYRLTLEFAAGQKKSDTRYALQFELDISFS